MTVDREGHTFWSQWDTVSGRARSDRRTRHVHSSSLVGGHRRTPDTVVKSVSPDSGLPPERVTSNIRWTPSVYHFFGST